MKKVYICSPYRGDVENNIRKARKYCRNAIRENCLPIAPHIYFTQFLDDVYERSKAFAMNKQILKQCDELWVCGKYISPGMLGEIYNAHRFNVPVIYKKGDYYD